MFFEAAMTIKTSLCSESGSNPIYVQKAARWCRMAIKSQYLSIGPYARRFALSQLAKPKRYDHFRC